MVRFVGAFVLMTLSVCTAAAQNAQPVVPVPLPIPAGPQVPSMLSATAARCRVTQARRVGLEELVRMECAENHLTMEVWIPPRENAPWLAKDLPVTVIPIIMAPDVRVSPGRTPRSDYSRPKPVHVQVSGGKHQKVVATLVSLTFY